MGNVNIQIGERLKEARILLGFDKAISFSERLGLENQTYGRYEKGERSLPDEIKLQLHEMGINLSWLVAGQGNPFLDKQNKEIPLIAELQELIDKTMEPKLGNIEARFSAIESHLNGQKPRVDSFIAESTPEYKAEEKCKKIPFVDSIAAGPPITQSDYHGEMVSVPVRLMRKGDKYYAATIRGDSMKEAGIRDGDMVLIRYTNVPKDGAIQLVRYQDKSTLKLLREIEGKGWELHYRDGTGRVITCDSSDYETQGEFEAILTGKTG